MAKATKTETATPSTTVVDIMAEVGDCALEYFKSVSKIKHGMVGPGFEVDFTKAVPKQTGFDSRVRKPLLRYLISGNVSSGEEGESFEVLVTRGVSKILTVSCTDKKKIKSMVKDAMVALLEDAAGQANYYLELASDTVVTDFNLLNESGALSGTYHNIPESGYHRCPGVSKSQLTPIQKNYDHFKMNLEKKVKETDAMKLGSVLHLKVLEPKRYKNEVILMDIDKRTVEGKIQGLLNDVIHVGKYVIDAEIQAKVIGMEMSLAKHPIIPSIINESNFETSLFWKNEVGSLSRGRVDGHIPKPSKKLAELLANCTPYTEEQLLGSEIVWDLKTSDSADEEDFARKMFDMDYHVQAAYYSAGMKQISGRNVIFIFIVVESSGTFSCDFHMLGDADLELGERTYMRWLTKHDQHVKNPKLWGGYSLQKGFISLPSYAFSREKD